MSDSSGGRQPLARHLRLQSESDGEYALHNIDLNGESSTDDYDYDAYTTPTAASLPATPVATPFAQVPATGAATGTRVFVAKHHERNAPAQFCNNRIRSGPWGRVCG